jgi:uncharacterized protein
VIFLRVKNYVSLNQKAAVRENLEKLVKQGKKLVLFNFARGAFEDWPEFADLAGRARDRKATHDPRRPFTVEIAEPQHPIRQEMHEFQADHEPYTCLLERSAGASFGHTARSKVTGKDPPMAFVFEYDKGRVYHAPLQHDVRAIEMPGVAELIRRGCRWAAGRQP